MEHVGFISEFDNSQLKGGVPRENRLAQARKMMCHSTGTEVVLNVTAHRAVPRTGIGELLYGFKFFVEGIMRLEEIPSFRL